MAGEGKGNSYSPAVRRVAPFEPESRLPDMTEELLGVRPGDERGPPSGLPWARNLGARTSGGHDTGRCGTLDEIVA